MDLGASDWPLDTEWREVRGVRISRHACVADWVTLGADVVVHPFALVGHLASRSRALAHPGEPAEWLKVGAATEIGPHTTIYGGATIGAGCLIGDGASIREGVVIGGGCIIGRNVTVGFGVTIGDNVRIMDGSFVAEGARIGSRTLLGAGVVMSGDKRPDLVNYRYAGEGGPQIGEGCLIGSGANLMAGVRIADRAVIGAGALVIADVPEGDTVRGERSRSIHEQARLCATQYEVGMALEYRV